MKGRIEDVGRIVWDAHPLQDDWIGTIRGEDGNRYFADCRVLCRNGTLPGLLTVGREVFFEPSLSEGSRALMVSIHPLRSKPLTHAEVKAWAKQARRFDKEELIAGVFKFRIDGEEVDRDTFEAVLRCV